MGRDSPRTIGGPWPQRSGGVQLQPGTPFALPSETAFAFAGTHTQRWGLVPVHASVLPSPARIAQWPTLCIERQIAQIAKAVSITLLRRPTPLLFARRVIKLTIRGFRMALAHPDRMEALIIQDAVARNEGRGDVSPKDSILNSRAFALQEQALVHQAGDIRRQPCPFVISHAESTVVYLATSRTELSASWVPMLLAPSSACRPAVRCRWY